VSTAASIASATKAPSREARYLAAVKACGEHAALSGAAAAFLYRLTGGISPDPGSGKVDQDLGDGDGGIRRLGAACRVSRGARASHAWELDRRREREARARGDDFRRFTWGDVFNHPGQMLTELRAVISAAW
jgi:hypothetical protein